MCVPLKNIALEWVNLLTYLIISYFSPSVFSFRAFYGQSPLFRAASFHFARGAPIKPLECSAKLIHVGIPHHRGDLAHTVSLRKEDLRLTHTNTGQVLKRGHAKFLLEQNVQIRLTDM